jgi:crotonobetainyl-CoA:carnitine CoA-transferase CaiB-like acyl-CoA transferase
MSEAPLAGIRVVEFSHMVMGTSAGVILGDLGAEVIKVEPPGGDKTRRLRGLGLTVEEIAPFGEANMIASGVTASHAG